MAEEPWDEVSKMRDPNNEVGAMHTQDEEDGIPPIKSSNSIGTTHSATSYTSSKAGKWSSKYSMDDDIDNGVAASTSASAPSSGITGIGGGVSSNLPDRWAKYELDADTMREESERANAKAVTMAAERAYEEKLKNLKNASMLNSSMSSLPVSQTAAPAEAGPAALAGNARKWKSEFRIDDDDDELMGKCDDIRAEAMKILEQADHKLTAPFSVHRTESGGFTTMESGYTVNRTQSGAFNLSKKKVPAALAGLNLQGGVSPSRLSALSVSSRSARSRSSALMSSPVQVAAEHLQENLQDIDDEENLDMIDDMVNPNIDNTIEKEAMPSESKWSSRYSIDNTLLALSGGKKSPKDIIDEFDKELEREAKSAYNLGAHDNKAKIFGAGFNFRQNHVFGKQEVSIKRKPSDEDNLHTVWLDVSTSGQSLPPPEPRKTWQEQREYKIRMRRRLILFIAAAVLVAVSFITAFTYKKNVIGTNASTSDNELLFQGKPVSFYVTSNAPFNKREEDRIKKDLASLSTADGAFVVHLGNIQDSSSTLCSRSTYPSAKSALLNSNLPLFVLPGEEDWNNCPDPSHAWTLWQDYLGVFESNFDHPFRVNRQSRRHENFGFVHNKVLFIGFHLVNGRVDDIDDWNARHEDDIAWMESMVTLSKGQFRAIVMFGNARPGPQQRSFFSRLKVYLGDKVPVVYVHANSGVGGLQQYQLFENTENIQALQVEDGGENPPIKISVAYGDKPFSVEGTEALNF